MSSIPLPRLMRTGSGAVDQIGDVVAGLAPPRPFYTRQMTATTRWQNDTPVRADFSMPTHE
ncbi:hypothetical protein [Rhodococcus koreensis]|uniref:hypothetical protein n=1 Tax=Rhodococcus koreensis TaxID=99653 RepID=UPI00198165B4|nr:hypothetical protein [Rhodococcus koreensis]QSE86984.1 hypothetical protein JWS14_48885 [Rhodococcus koreensis]